MVLRLNCYVKSLGCKSSAAAETKAPEVVLELLRYAINSWHRAKYVLFDSWFSTPNTLVRIKEMGLMMNRLYLQELFAFATVTGAEQ